MGLLSEGWIPYDALQEVGRDLCHCKQILVSFFDGRSMNFVGVGKSLRFEECPSGLAFNYRRTIAVNAKTVSERYHPEIDADEFVASVSVPFSMGGCVVGAVEIVDPEESSIPDEAISILCTICGALIDPPKARLN